MKKLCLLLVTVAALALSFVGATSAYFTDSITTENVIISGNIHIQQYEQERQVNADGTVTLDRFTQYQEIAPLVQHGAANSTEVAVGDYKVQMRNDNSKNYVDKIVTVKNTGVNPAYVRTFIAIPTAGYDSSTPTGDNWLHWDINQNSTNWNWGTKTDADGNISGVLQPSGNNWHLINDVTIGDQVYDIYVTTYGRALKAGETSEPSMLGFYLDSATNYNGTNLLYTTGNGTKLTLSDMPTLNILVATQATQTTTFDDPWTALDTVFGAAAADNHPWNNSHTKFAGDQETFNNLLDPANTPSGFTIRLSSGTYDLSKPIPAGIRIVGQGEVFLKCGTAVLTASAVDFCNVTFSDNVTFLGNGEFDQVTFNGSFNATFNNPASFVDCSFSSAPTYTVAASAVRDTVTFENCIGAP